MYIHWAYLLVAFFVGVFFGMLIICCCAVAGYADERHERLMAKLEKKETAI